MVIVFVAGIGILFRTVIGCENDKRILCNSSMINCIKQSPNDSVGFDNKVTIGTSLACTIKIIIWNDGGVRAGKCKIPSFK